MEHDYKKVTQLIGWLLLVIVVCFSFDLILLSGRAAPKYLNSAQASTEVAKTGVLAEQEKAQLRELLSGLLLCGQWPITGSQLSAGRGNPFEPKQIQPRQLFVTGILDLETRQPDNACRSVQEALNK